MNCPYCNKPIETHEPGEHLDRLFIKFVLGYKEEAGYWVNKKGQGVPIYKWNFFPSTNVSQAMEGENKLERGEDRARYCGLLEQIIVSDLGFEPVIDDFYLIHAIAHQRTRALVMWAMERER